MNRITKARMKPIETKEGNKRTIVKNKAKVEFL